MKLPVKKSTTVVAALVFFFFTRVHGAAGEAPPPGEPLSLWYRQPATNWVECAARGQRPARRDGFRRHRARTLQLNEDTLWAGGPYDPDNTNALAALPEVRRLIFDGKFAEAQKLASQKMMAKPLRQMPYETLGDLLLTFPTNAVVENYRRDLNLDTAVASVSYTANGVYFKREIFSSPVDQVIVVRLTATSRATFPSPSD